MKAAAILHCFVQSSSVGLLFSIVAIGLTAHDWDNGLNVQTLFVLTPTHFDLDLVFYFNDLDSHTNKV